MTNRKFKDYRKNLIAYRVIVKNYEILCTILLTLNQQFPKTFYAKKCAEWMETYTASCRVADEWERDGTLDWHVAQRLTQNSIDDALIKTFVKKQAADFHPQNREVLAGNVRVALIQTAEDYGIGPKRIEQLQRALLTADFHDPCKEVGKFGITDEREGFDVGAVDCRRLNPPVKNRETVADIRHAADGLDAFRRWSAEHVRGGRGK